MMELREKSSIYAQIADYACDQILLKKWLPGEKIPSIREFSETMQVTGVTVQRAYDYLVQEQIIATKRGIGYFVTIQAEEIVLAFRREQFMQYDLPVFLKNIQLLGISLEEIGTYYKKI